MCRIMAEDDPDANTTEEEFAETFNVSRQTINNWISDIRTRQKGSRDGLIIRLSKLGWTQEEIAEKVGITQQRVQQITNNANFGKICNDYNDGKSISEIAEYYGLDIPVVWS